MQNYKITNEDIDENGYLIEQYPEEIQGYFDCSNIALKSLKGVPKKIGRYFDCSKTEITSLEGAPLYVGMNFYCFDNKISSLQDIGRKFLKEIKGGAVYFNECHIKSHILGLLLVENLKYISFNSNYEIQQIINRHLKGNRDVLECQEELINKGYKEYAKL